MHRDTAKSWTTTKLTRLRGCSRSAFNLRFTRIVGVAPMRYLHGWRMAVAKDELRRGERSVAEIAFLIGFQSGGAFTRAFTRSAGSPPPALLEGIALPRTLRPTKLLFVCTPPNWEGTFVPSGCQCLVCMAPLQTESNGRRCTTGLRGGGGCGTDKPATKRGLPVPFGAA